MNTKRRSTARKSKGTKSKKPKFLSLRLQFPTDETNQIKQSGNPHTAAAAATADTSSDQPNPISLRSEHPSEERESNDHENVEFYFSSAADGVAATLTGLLDAAESNSSHANNSSSRLDYPSPASLTQAYGEERAALVRNALRSRDRDSSEEKWVCYSEVVKEEEVTSSAVDPAGIRRMSLKLDYEEIMNAWSDRGPLYIDNSQIVPDINHLFLSHEPPGHYDGLNMGCNVGSWIVPEMVGDIEENGEMMMINNNPRRMKERDDELMKMMGQREASVLRYKEKRQNRLFSKKIRYQVRKLNAEKRPRLKGRFVKRD